MLSRSLSEAIGRQSKSGGEDIWIVGYLDWSALDVWEEQVEKELREQVEKR